MKVLEVGFIHDLVCSWCPIGYARLTQAIELLSHEIEIRVRYLPFELNPQLTEQGISISDYFIKIHGWGEDQLLPYQQRVTQVAKDHGVTIDYTQRQRYFPTRNAHMALLISSKYGCQSKMRALLQQAYYVEGKNISQKSVLSELAIQAGVRAEHFEQSWHDGRIHQALADDLKLVRRLKVRSVPALLLNNQVIPVPEQPDLLVRLLQNTALTPLH